MTLQSYSIIAITLIIAFAAVSCSDKCNTSESVITVMANDAINAPVDSITKELEIIPLELNENHYPHGVKSVTAADSIFIVTDNKNIVYLYDKYGKYISDSANKIGNGAGEYSIVTAMSCNAYNSCIEIVTPMNLLIYDKDFNLVKSCALPTKKSKDGLDGMFFGFIHDISENEHLLIPEGALDDNRKIIRYDSDKEKVISTLKYNEDVIADMTMQTHCFQNVSENELMFFPPGISNYIYSYNLRTNSIDKKYFIDFGTNGLVKSDISKMITDKDRLKMEILNTEKIVPLSTMLCGDRLIIVYKDGRTLRNFHTLIWDLKLGTGYVIDSYNNEKYKFPVVYYSDSTNLYGIVDRENLSQITQGIGSYKIKTPQDSIPDGSLVILRYALKR